MKELKIKFEAYGTPETANNVYSNFCENYPEFSSNMTEEDYEYNKQENTIMMLWSGEFKEGELDDNDMDGFYKLTHHAEGLYEDTDAEYVHVEVCEDGKWYGR